MKSNEREINERSVKERNMFGDIKGERFPSPGKSGIQIPAIRSGARMTAASISKSE